MGIPFKETNRDDQHFWDVETVWCSGSGFTSCAKWSEMVSNTETTAVEMFVMTLSMAVHDVAVTLVGKFTAHSNPKEFNTS
ncbi:hypothetical protein J6590_062951 [Homalodisca vitripennis]|nr:hypothetical protein J6590_062951 [Homalodisca vitripennis]